MSYTKTQLVTSKKYAKYRDFLNGNLEDGKTYSFETVDKLLEKSYNLKPKKERKGED